MTYNYENPTCDNRIGLSKQIPFHGKYMSDANCTKRCTKCGIEQPSSAYSKHKKSSDGLSTICKSCCKVANKIWREKNAELCKASNRKYYEENKERLVASSIEWRNKNKERFLANERKRRSQNPEKAREAVKRWSENNKEKLRCYQASLRARRRSADGKHTSSEVRVLKDRQNHKCAVCKNEVHNHFHVDHIVPLAKGGSNNIDNLQVLCPSCNRSKGAKDPIEFMQSRGFLL